MAYDENIYARIVSGEVSDEEIKKLKESGEWDEIQKIIKVSGDLSLPAYNKEDGFENLTKRRDSIKAVEPKRRLLNPLWIGMAASVLLLLAFLFVFNADKTIEAAGLAENKTSELPDGSVVILNDGSQFEYATKRWASSRKLKLEGEAYFQVESGEKFIVNTNKGLIEVLGTEFNVRAWGDNLLVECYEGSVRVSSVAMEAVLEKNQSVKFIGGEMSVVNTIENSRPLWLEGTSRFYDENLSEVFRELERQYDRTIEFNQDTRKFSGSFQEGNIEKALKQVCDPMGLKFDIIDDKKIVIRD